MVTGNNNAIKVVPRVDNINFVRAKGGVERIVHVNKELMQWYSAYLIDEYPDDLDCDFVFVVTKAPGKGEIGKPLSYQTVNSLFRRLSKKTGIDVNPHLCKDCKKQFTIGAERPDVLYASEKFDFNHDVWTANHLGYENGIHKHYQINFGYIEQSWLKHYFKKYILYLSSTRLAFSTLNGKVQNLTIFSRCLTSRIYNLEFEGINRSLILDYLAYLKVNKYSYSQYTHCRSNLKTFFETGTYNHWFIVEPALIRPEDWQKQPKRNLRYIPEDVMQQLMQHIEHLPEPVMRMLLVDIECGFRIGELTRLKLDCLKSDGKGGWYIQYYMSKMSKDHTKPISHELAEVIKEQQTYIQGLFGNSF